MIKVERSLEGMMGQGDSMDTDALRQKWARRCKHLCRYNVSENHTYDSLKYLRIIYSVMFNLETTWKQEKNRICGILKVPYLKCSGLWKAAPHSRPSFDPFSFHFNRIIHHRDPAHYLSPHVKALSVSPHMELGSCGLCCLE